MSDSIKRMLEMLEPQIYDLKEKEEELLEKKELFDKVSRFVAYTNGDVHLVGSYSDQDFIFESLKDIDINVDEYKASCYLIRSDEKNIQQLPQYSDSVQHLMNLISHFRNKKAGLTTDISGLEKECQRKKIEENYYNMFANDNVYVSDVNEFEEFLDSHGISDDDKKEILLLVIKKNIEEYQKELRGNN